MYVDYLINTYTRKVDLLDTGKVAAVQSNINVDGIKFSCEGLDNLDLATCAKTILYSTPDDTEKLHTYVVTNYNYDEEEKIYYLYWDFNSDITSQDGIVTFSLSFYTINGENIDTQWNSIKTGFRVFPTNDKYQVIPEYTQDEKATIMQQINSLFTKWDQVSDTWADISNRFEKIEPEFYSLQLLVKGGTAVAIDDSKTAIVVNSYTEDDNFNSISEMLIAETNRATSAEQTIDNSMIESASLVSIGTTDTDNDTIIIKTVSKKQ